MVTKQISLNVWELNDVVIYANSGEVDSRFIEVIFKDKSQSIINLSNCTVTFYAKKPDDTKIFNYCTIDTINNTATVELTSQTLSVPGVLECEFQILNSNNNLLKVQGLKIFVSSSKDFSESVESTSEFQVLTSTINEAKNIMSSVGKTINLNTNAKNTIVEAINEVNTKVIPISQGGTGASTTTGTRTNMEVMKITTLYNNNSGTTGTITLSSSVGNFEYIDIFYKADGAYFAFQRVHSPNNKGVHIFVQSAYSPNNVCMAFTSVLNFVNTTVTWNSTSDSFLTVNTSGGIGLTFSRSLIVYKIIGYSY